MVRLYLICALLVAALVGLSLYYRAEPDTFYGIADAKEIVISSESPVEIRRILVVQGQLVNQGDTLLEVHNGELDMRLSQISHELNELKARKAAHATLSKSEILQLKAQQEERVSEIRAEIKELEAQYDLNKELVSELRSLNREKAAAGGGSVVAQNPIQIKLESLRKLLELAQDPSRVYENRLASALSSESDPLTEQVSRLEDEKRILEGDRSRQVIPAQISGVIGSINFKVGEKVSPFNPILTLHAAAPSIVRGYIHEDVYSQVAVKQKVKVHGVQNHSTPVEGLIVGVGSRIVEYPERLRKRADILIWGREVVIQLPADNRFLLGEKVLISLPRTISKGPLLPKPEASATGSDVDKAQVAQVAVAGAVAGLPAEPKANAAKTEAATGPAAETAGSAAEFPGLEVSGLLLLEDIGKLLMISDDTEKNRPLVFLTDAGFKDPKTVTSSAVQGLDKMDDMEAVSAGEDGSLYLLSSQSRNSKGKLKDARKLLVKAARKGDVLTLEGKVLLLDALSKAAAADPKADWAAFLSGGIAAGTVDIEGMAAKKGDIYLGFKAPLRDGKAVILKLAGADKAIKEGAIAAGSLSLWKSLDLRGAGEGGKPGSACGIADLAFRGEDLYVISSGTAGSDDPNAGDGAAGAKRGHTGGLWRLPAGADKASLIKDFQGDKAEGVAVADARSLFIGFDNGAGKPSKVIRLEVR